MAAKKRKTVLVASTSEVYGKSQNIPFHEEGDLISGPTSKSRWSYASSKIVDEFLALAYWREQKVPTIVVRPFNCMGPRQTGRYGMVVPRFINQALKGENISVYGSGQQSRSFTYVSDIVHWLLALAGNEKAIGQVFNLGNPSEITMTNLAQRIITLTGSSSEIEYIPYEKAYEHGFEDIERRTPDITKVTSLTGHYPAVGLEEALRRTCDWVASQTGRTAPVYAETLK
jgi:UDP-glucose 4-epimerase